MIKTLKDFKIGKAGKVKMELNKKNSAFGFIAVVALGALAFNVADDAYDWAKVKTGGFWGLASSSETLVGQAGAAVDNIDLREGVAATAYFNAFDLVANTETEVYPEYWIFDSSDNKLVNGVNANSTTTTKGDVLMTYVGGNTYYGSEPTPLEVSTEAPTYTIDAFTIASESSIVTTVYNSDNLALTADDDAENNADYSIDMNADDVEFLSVKFANEDADTRLQFQTVCTFINNDVDDFEVVEDGWVKTILPDGMKDATIDVRSDTDVSVNISGYDTCYKAPSLIVLDENQEIKIKTKLSTDATAPAANGHDVAGLILIDSSYEDGKDGKVYFDSYKHDATESVSAVGLAETVNSPMGRQIGAVIELQ